LLLLLLAAFLIESATVFLFSAIVMLSWIRSGTCFKRKPIVKIRCGARRDPSLGAGGVAVFSHPGAVLCSI
jgi:hypothetical protein